MQVPHDAFVVVADGRKMLFFRNQGDADYPNLIVERVREQDNPPNRDHATDGPGTSFSSVGNGRSSYEETDFHQLEEDRFAAETAELRARMEQMLDRLIRNYPADEIEPGAWWMPKAYGGSAPTIEEAEAMYAEERRQRAARKRAKAKR